MILLYSLLVILSSSSLGAKVFNAYTSLPPRLTLREASVAKDYSLVSRASFYHHQASKSYDHMGNIVPLFDNGGGFDFAKFVKQTYSATYNSSNHFDAGPATTDFRTALNSLPDGYVATCAGKAEHDLVNLDFSLNLIQGFFAQLTIPLVSTRVGGLHWVMRDSVASDNTNLQTINQKFDQVLLEHGIKPLSQGFDDRGLGDVMCGAGWSYTNFFDKEENFVNRFSFMADLGFILPTSTLSEKSQSDYMFALPLGHYEHLGTYSNMLLQFDFFQIMSLCANVFTKSFCKKKQHMRVPYSENLSSFVFGPQAHVDFDLGSFWSMSGYLKMGWQEKGLNLVLGYSYQSQEPSGMSLLDDADKSAGVYNTMRLNQLKTYNTGGGNYFDGYANLGASTPFQVEQRIKNNFVPVDNFLINKNANLQRWYCHVLHFGVLFQPRIEDLEQHEPLIKLVYNYPVWGKNAFVCQGIECGLQCALSFNF